LRANKGHTGLYVNSDSLYELKSGRENLIAGVLFNITESNLQHGIVQASGESPGGGGEIVFVSFNAYLAGDKLSDFWGAYEKPNLSALNRRDIIVAGLGKLGKGYGFMKRHKGPETFRCDGFVEYAYETARQNIVPDYLENFWFPPRKQKDYLNKAVVTPPSCGAISILPEDGEFKVSLIASDGQTGSGIDRVEFYSDDPNRGGVLLGTDDHDELIEGDYSTLFPNDPGSSVHVRVYDQAGNWSICQSAGEILARSGPQVIPPFFEDKQEPEITQIVTSSTESVLTIKWIGSDDVTQASALIYSVALDKPFEEWDETQKLFIGPTWTVSGVDPDVHTAYIIGIDQEGNYGRATKTFEAIPPRLVVKDEKGNLIPTVPVLKWT
jgi:hypothetical protein